MYRYRSGIRVSSKIVVILYFLNLIYYWNGTYLFLSKWLDVEPVKIMCMVTYNRKYVNKLKIETTCWSTEGTKIKSIQNYCFTTFPSSPKRTWYFKVLNILGKNFSHKYYRFLLSCVIYNARADKNQLKFNPMGFFIYMLIK